MAVIELDLDAPPADHPVRLPPSRIHRWAGVALTAALVITLGGAAPFDSVLWQHSGTIPLAADGWFRLVGDQVYASDNKSIAAWDLAPARGARREGAGGPPAAVERRWTATPPMVEAVPDDGSMSTGGFLAVAGDTLVVQSPGWRTVLLDDATGRIGWRSPDPVEPATQGVGLTRQMTFRPGSENDRAGAQSGALYLSPNGAAYSEPPESTVLTGVDLATGRELWSLPGEGSIFTEKAGALMLVVSADRLALVEPRTGVVVRERAAADLSWSWVVDRTALVRHGTETVAYDLDTLTPRWRAPTDMAGGLCRGVICAHDEESLQVLDPATGVERWRTTPELSLTRDGDVVLEEDVSSLRPLRVLDAGTGAVRGTLEHWQAVSSGESIVLLRPNLVRKGFEFAVLRDGVVRPLGYTTDLVQDCRSSARFVACRSAAGLEIFRMGDR